MSGRRRVFLAVVLALSLCGAALWIASEMGRQRAVPPSLGASEEGEAPRSAATLLPAPRALARSEVEAGTDEVAGGTVGLRFVTAQGSPVPGVSVACFSSTDSRHAISGTADPRGFLELPADVRGTYCLVQAQKSGFAFLQRWLWAEGVTSLTLEGGCAVNLLVAAEDQDLLGGKLAFNVDGTAHEVEVSGPRTPLGRFRGGQLILGGLGGASSEWETASVVLPLEGEVDISYRPKRACRVQFETDDPRLDGAAVAVMRVGLEEAGQWTAERGSGGRSVAEARLPPGEYRFFAASRAASCEGHFEVPWACPDLVVPMRDDGSAPLVVRVPPELDVLSAELFVLPLRPWKARADRRTYDTPDIPTGVWSAAGAASRPPRGRLWPLAPRTEPAALVWSAVPTRSSCVVHVATRNWGVLAGETSIPSGAREAEIRLERPSLVLVEAVNDRGGAYLGEGLVSVLAETDSVGPPTARVRLVDGRARITGLPPGARRRFVVEALDRRGEVVATVARETAVRIPLADDAWPARSVRVVDTEGHAVGGVRVAFTRPDEVGTTVRADADGLAEVRLPASFTARAKVVDERYVSDFPVVTAGAQTLVVHRAGRLLVRYGGTERRVSIELVRGTMTVRTLVARVLPGAVAFFDHVECGDYRLVVKAIDEKDRTIFDRSISFQDPDLGLVEVVPE